MANISITKIIFASIPSGTNTYEVSYKKSSDVDYTLAFTDIQVLQNGNLVSPVTLTGLVPDEDYDIKFESECGEFIKTFTTVLPACVAVTDIIAEIN